ncbi:unnamed protein product [Phytophthora fragariaefolia]|uniref:Unnamed protein product n=1 Tax=Phytophthora fragariaefolia TaxID=1490495 RepID=A0A9W6U1A7_9STRA|nr:unnamed protein product [Phytophthora fragariaefolia]
MCCVNMCWKACTASQVWWQRSVQNCVCVSTDDQPLQLPQLCSGDIVTYFLRAILPGMAADRKRTCYSLQFKLNVVSNYMQNVDECGFNALAKNTRSQHRLSAIGITTSRNSKTRQNTARSLHVCYADSLERGARRSIISPRSGVTDGCARETKKGLRVKDKYIQLQVLNIHRAIVEAAPEQLQQASAVQSSSGWQV